MKLRAVTIRKFRNIIEPQRIEIEEDVTGLVGKNESGKTTILKALHRLNPANASEHTFDITTEYPRWRLARDRRGANLSTIEPVVAEFELDPSDIEKITEHLPAPPPTGTRCFASRNYADELTIWLELDQRQVVEAVATDTSVDEEDRDVILPADSIDSAKTAAKQRAKEIKEAEPLRSKALNGFATAVGHLSYLLGEDDISQEAIDILANRLPKFFYFSSYSLLPGESDLTDLAAKTAASGEYTEQERTVIALLAHAGESPKDFMDADYDSRKAELQAASVDLSQRVFEYWKQNTDLRVVFDTDNVSVGQHPQGGEITHRILKIEIRDDRHGGVETNFSTRSAGFQWFFSFFAAFSEYQTSTEPIIVLLDEPGTSLHGEAQKDFLRFIFEELGVSKQTLYTTHSQFMVDPTRYEKLRAVDDRATRDNPDQGVVVTPINLSADRNTILPIESALGYSISQHLLLGSGPHLAVEGSSDFVYLQRFSEYLVSQGKAGLDPQFSIIPVGGADNMPAFVALLGRRLKVSALVDGNQTSRKVARIKAAAASNGVPESAIVTCAQASEDLPTNADIEDLFDASDYLKIYNWTFGTDLQKSDLPDTEEPILRRIEVVRGKFDHALPSHQLSRRLDEFFSEVDSKSTDRFSKLLVLLNSTIRTGQN